MHRLSRIAIPRELYKDGRVKELLGQIRNNTIPQCVYNDIIIHGSIERDRLPIEETKRILYGELFNDLPKDYFKDYQVNDLSKMFPMDVVFNINKPGYGKTLETIAWIKFNVAHTAQKNPNILILCPKSVIETWHAQLRRYWPTYLEDCNWWITNYEQLHNKEKQAIAKGMAFHTIVLDESHKIKSMKSKITSIVFELEAEHKACLTGTPVKNRPQDLAAQLKWLDQYSITSFTDFQFTFCELQDNGFGKMPVGLTKNKALVNDLQLLLNYYCVGGKEHNASNITTPEYIKVRLKMDPKVKKLYSKVEGEYDKELQERIVDTQYLLDNGIKVSSAIESAIRRQQLASNPQLFNDKLVNVKFDWIMDWLDDTDEKVVIFSKFAKTIEQLDVLLKSKGYNVVTLKQSMSPALRQEAYNEFKTKKQVLLTTFGLTKEGVDGLQQVCNYIIFIDREWTASDNEQAEKRIYRLGQTKQPIFYILQCIGTIDVRIEHVQLDKGHDAKELLDPVSDEDL